MPGLFEALLRPLGSGALRGKPVLLLATGDGFPWRSSIV